jgi:hypothetical protein
MTASDDVQIVINRPPTNDTGGGTTTEGQPLRVEIIANPTQAFAPASINFDFTVTGGTPPYNFVLFQPGVGEVASGVGVGISTVNGDINLPFSEDQIGTHTFSYYVTDSKGTEASDSIQITIEERPGALLPGIAPGEEQQQEQPQAPPTTEEEPSPTTEEEPSPTTEEEPSPTTEEEPPPDDDTGGEG